MPINAELTILSSSLIWGNNKSKIFEKYSPCFKASDLSLATGAKISNNFEGLIPSWTRSIDTTNVISSTICTGDGRYNEIRRKLPVTMSDVGIVPVLKNYKVDNAKTGDIIELGEYPQSAVSLVTSKTLDELHSTSKLQKTGKTYTLKYIKYTHENFVRKDIFEEYEYAGKRYIKINPRFSRVKFFVNFDYETNLILSNGQVASYDDLWIEVKPVKWIVDRENDLLVSKGALLSGVPFATESKYNVNLENSNLKEFLDKHMFKDMFGIDYLITQKLYESYTYEDVYQAISEEINFLIKKINSNIKLLSQKENYSHLLKQIKKNYKDLFEKEEDITLEKTVDIYTSFKENLENLEYLSTHDLLDFYEKIDSSIEYLNSGVVKNPIINEVQELSRLINTLDMKSREMFLKELKKVLNSQKSNIDYTDSPYEKMRTELKSFKQKVQNYYNMNELKVTKLKEIDAIYDTKLKSDLKDKYLTVKYGCDSKYLDEFTMLLENFEFDLESQETKFAIEKFESDYKTFWINAEENITKNTLLVNIQNILDGKTNKSSDVLIKRHSPTLRVLLCLENIILNFMETYNSLDSSCVDVIENIYDELKHFDYKNADINDLKYVYELYLCFKEIVMDKKIL